MGLGRLKPAVTYVHDVRQWARQSRNAGAWIYKKKLHVEPILSVVIPCHNASRWIATLIHSIQAQRIDDIEIIVIDDKSTDHSKLILKSLALVDDRIRIIDGQGKGPGAARNIGISLATGRYLAFADADDLVLPGAYSAMLNSLKKTGSDFVFGGYLRHRNSSSSRPQIVERTHLKHVERATAQSFPQAFEEPVLWNKIFRTDFWRNEVGPMPEDLNYEDQPPILRAIIAATSFDVLTQDVYSWRLSDEGHSRSSVKSKLNDLEDRTAVTHLMWNEAKSQNAPHELLQFMLERFIARDLNLYAVHLPQKPYGDPFRIQMRELAKSLEEWASDFPNLHNEIPMARRSLLWVLANGSDEDVDEELGLRMDTSSGYAFSSDGSLLKDCVPNIVGLPLELLSERSIDTPVRTKAQSVDWQDTSTIELQIRAFVAGVDSDEVELEFFAVPVAQLESVLIKEKTLQRSQQIAFERKLDRRNNAEVQDPWHDRNADSYLLRIKLSGTEDLAIVAKATWNGKTSISNLKAGSDWASNIPGPIGNEKRWIIIRKRDVGGLCFVLSPQVVTNEMPELSSWRRSILGINLNIANRDSEEIPSKVGVRALPLGYQRMFGWAKTKPLTADGKRVVVNNAEKLLMTSCEKVQVLPDTAGFAKFNQKALRVVIDDAFLNGGLLTIVGRCSSRFLRPTIWLSSSNQVIKAKTTWIGREYTAVFDAASVRGMSYFLRWSLFSKNRFTRAAVEPRGLLGNVFAPGEVKSFRIEPRLNGTTAVFPLPPREITKATSWEIYRGVPKQEKPLISGILFESFSGKNSKDNPGAICEHLLRNGLDVPLWVSVRDHTVSVPYGAIPVITGSDEWYDKLTRAKVIVGNDNFPLWFRKRKGQSWLQTWHGWPIKRLLFDAHPNFVGLSYRRLMKRQAQDWDLLLAQSVEAGKLIAGSAYYDGVILEGEYPRNYSLAQSMSEISVVKKRLGIPEGKTVILWAPTWRYSKDDIEFPAAEIARENDAIVLIRGHHMKAISKSGPNVLNVSSYPNVEELMAVSDLLVSDYSSIFFDYALTGRPSIVYVPDLERYRSEERGFYGNWPYDSGRPIAEDPKQLRQAIKSTLAEPHDEDTQFRASNIKERVEGNLASISEWVVSRLN